MVILWSGTRTILDICECVERQRKDIFKRPRGHVNSVTIKVNYSLIVPAFLNSFAAILETRVKHWAEKQAADKSNNINELSVSRNSLGLPGKLWINDSFLTFSTPPATSRIFYCPQNDSLFYGLPGIRILPASPWKLLRIVSALFCDETLNDSSKIFRQVQIIYSKCWFSPYNWIKFAPATKVVLVE